MVNEMIADGYPPGRLGAAGFGEFDPVESNDSKDGRAQNRRIEIVLMPNLGEIPGMKEMLQSSKKKKKGR
jgi:chemotaxis protein MotB